MTHDWRETRPPTLEEFDSIAKDAWLSLPAEFRKLCRNVVIHVADFAEPGLLSDLRIDDPFDLTGLYEGIDIIQQRMVDPDSSPHHIHLFRRPILDEWISLEDVKLGDLISHVLVHEIGHHFGLSDEQMHAIEEAAGD